MLGIRIVVFLAVFGCIAADDPLVEAKCGKLAGKSVEFSHEDVDVKRTVYVFRGIPYVEAPVGDLRFGPPQTKVPWDGVYDATEVGFACTQPTNPFVPVYEPKNEDCLFMNIYAPQTNSGKLPVMVWIHGGGFSIGSGSNDGIYDGTALAAIGDVVVVSFNYRLGLFGFFTSGDEQATGNYGFLDQVAALQWVQDNIAAFGGDAGRVTIFGESAGSMSVDLLLLSPLTDGLFHRTIMQSGSSSFDGIFREDAAVQTKLAHGLGKLVGCEKDTTVELVQCLRTVPADDFEEPLDQTKGMLANVTGVDPEIAMYPFPPVVDGHFITGITKDLLSQDVIIKTNVNIMIGTNADEGTLFLPMILPHMINETEISMNRTVYEQLCFASLFGSSFKNNPAVQDAIKLMYVNWEDADSDEADYVDAFSQMQGDYMFVCPADLSARAYAQSGANVYMYHMTHTPANSIFRIKWMKAGHGEDIQFVFGGHFGVMNWTMPAEEVTMSLKVIKYWTNFAKTGNPNLSDFKGEPSVEDWPLFKVPGLAYKDLSLKMENKRALKAAECAFWNDFIPKLVKYTDVGEVCAATPDDETRKYTEEANQP